MLLEVALGDPITWLTAALVVFTIPSGVLAYQSTQDRAERRAERERRSDERRLTEAVAKKLLGEGALRDPERAAVGPTIASTVEAVDFELGASEVAGAPYALAAEPGASAPRNGDRYDHAHCNITIGAAAGSQRVAIVDGEPGAHYGLFLPVSP